MTLPLVISFTFLDESAYFFFSILKTTQFFLAPLQWSPFHEGDLNFPANVGHLILHSVKTYIPPYCVRDSMDVSLGKLQELVMGREAWHDAVHGVAKSQTHLSHSTTRILSGLPFPPARDLPDSGIEPAFPTQGWSPTLGGWFFTMASPTKSLHQLHHY